MAGGLWTVILLTVGYIICLTRTGAITLQNRHILRYEPLHYSRDELHRRHVRSTTGADLHFTIKAYGRRFRLRLERDTSQFTEEFQVMQGRQLLKPDLSFIYRGEIIGQPGSSVYCAVINGTFQGTLDIPGDTTYTIERSDSLFAESPPFHSVIYSNRDIDWAGLGRSIDSEAADNLHPPTPRWSGSRYRLQRAEHSPHNPWTRIKREAKTPLQKRICTLKLTADHVMWDYMMRRNNQIRDRARNEIIYIFKSHVTRLNSIFGKTTFIANEGSSEEMVFSGIQFEIRNVTILDWNYCYDVDGNWRDEDLCSRDANANILNVFARKESDEHWDVDYENSYDPDYEYTAEYDMNETIVNPIKNECGSIVLLLFETTHYDYSESQEYTEYSSQSGAEDVCLSYLFTARVLYVPGLKLTDPPQPRIGAAFAAVPDTIAGICTKGGNFGLVTFVQINEETYLPPPVTQLVFSHEVGHSFGSQHDNNEKCAKYFPSYERPADGHYLMYSITQQGRELNNAIFSNCSRHFIGQILSDDHYTQCFQESKAPFCGNNIVEAGEECDCGMAGVCDDRCCNARGHNPNNTRLDCTLKQSAVCSPSQGPCCDGHRCTHIPRSSQFVCQNARPCVDPLYCDGDNYGSSCPAPTPAQVREENFLCNNNGRVCDKGECNGSICRLIRWRECQAVNDAEQLSITEREELCYVACQQKKTTECVSTNNLAKVKQHADLYGLLKNVSQRADQERYPIQLPVGTPCNNEHGYCDVFHRCRGMNPDTALARLKNCLTSGECLQALLNFLQNYWWAVTLITIAGVTVMTFIVCFCSVHTKSDNPVLERKNPSLKWRNTIRNPRKSFRKSTTRFKRSFSRHISRYDGETMDPLTEIPKTEPTDQGDTSDISEFHK